jgi:hypothetical protein
MHGPLSVKVPAGLDPALSESLIEHSFSERSDVPFQDMGTWQNVMIYLKICDSNDAFLCLRITRNSVERYGVRPCATSDSWHRDVSAFAKTNLCMR